MSHPGSQGQTYNQWASLASLSQPRGGGARQAIFTHLFWSPLTKPINSASSIVKWKSIPDFCNTVFQMLPRAWLAFWTTGWGVHSDSRVCVRACVCTQLQRRTGSCVWHWKINLLAFILTFIIANASAPTSIYALSIRPENPDLLALQVMLFSLRSSFNIFTPCIHTQSES